MVQTRGTFRVTVRDHVMIAHSLHGGVFGPAQRLHGATYEVIAEFATQELDAHGLVIDPGVAQQVLGDSLAPLRYRNLDSLPAFAGVNTTNENLAHWLHGEISTRAKGHFHGTLRVALEVGRIAAASFEGPIA